MTEQAVTETTDDAASQASEATGEQDMDALLASYDEKAAPAEPAAPTDESTRKIDEVHDFMVRQERANIDRDYHTAGNEIAEKLDLPYDEAAKKRMGRGLLLEAIEGDARIMKAFSDRKSNPDKWDAVKQGVADSILSGKIDKQATASRTAVQASMTRGSTETEPDDDNGKAEAKRLRGLSDVELYKEVGLIE